ncbi:PA14 domain-containing protein, partial [Streptomyces sp. KR55]|uniref:PA14 domain-containing protein n=1 Tax=Streptomyces sp. KR55 TaxID=3457425 RepID=UPI003FD045FA
MRIRPFRDRLALLLAAVLGITGLAATPAATAADDPVDVHGLKGEYYTHSAPGTFDFHELKATGFDPRLDFDSLESRLRAATGRSDDVSVRWTGRIVPEKTGPTTFSIIGDNGFRLWIDDRPVIDHWVDDWDREQTSEPVELTAGRAYDIKVEYFEHYGGSNLHLRWTPPGGTKTAVPQSAFLLPEGYDYDGAIATTVLPDGRTLRLDFAQELAPPPAGLTDHLDAVIGGATWPLGDAHVDPAAPRSLLVALDEPVVGNRTGTAPGLADVRYDGEGGLAGRDGNVVNAFWSSGPNHSTHQLRTRWADDVTPDNAHREYPRPQLTRDSWRNLNGTWQFAAARAGEQPPFGRNLDEEILVPYPVESQLSGVERHEDRMWYRRTFTVPSDWRIGTAKRLQLN